MTSADNASAPAGNLVLMVVVWLWVLVPFLYGLISLLGKIPALFTA